MRNPDISKAVKKSVKNTAKNSQKNTQKTQAPLGSMRNLQPPTSGVASSGSPITFVDKETGEYVLCEHLENGSLLPTNLSADNALVARLESWILQSASKHLLPIKRVAKCCRLRASTAETVNVLHNSKLGTAHFGNLQTCGSVWDCNPCAKKISERRRVTEVLPAMDKWVNLHGGEVLLLTLTNPHNKFDLVSQLTKGQQKAMSIMTGSRAYRLLKEQIGMVGTIRAWEVTHGENGFHPHFHILLFVRAGLDLESIEGSFHSMWANSCRLAGLREPNREHGVKLHDGSKAHAYATKGVWGLDHEITKGHLKKSNKGRSPVDLLRSYVYDGDKQAGALFVEYSNSFHGKRQLYWTPGLKDYFSIGELSDEEIAAQQDENAYLLGRIEWPAWKLVLKSELRGEILELGRLGNWDGIALLIEGLVSQYSKSTKSSEVSK